MSRHPLALRRAAAAALATLALGSLSACGGDEEDSAADSSSASSSESSESPAEASTPEESEDGPAEGEEVSKDDFVALYTAAMDKATTAEMSMVTSSQAGDMTAEGEVDYSTKPASMDMEMSMPAQEGDEAGSMEMIMVDGVMYMKIPGMTEGDKYAKLDLNDPNNPFGAMLGDQMDLRGQTEIFAKGLTKVVFTGAEDVDGEEMDRYSVTVDTKAMFDSLDMEKSLKDLAMQEAPKSIAYDIWFDDEDLFRRIDYDMGKSMGEVSMTLDDWGTDVTIEAPPADQVSTGSLFGGAPAA